jgi:cytosine/adenosine deaminase-related metal-dependent hydrolase
VTSPTPTSKNVERTTLLKQAKILLTMDEDRREIAGGSLLLRGNSIVKIFDAAEQLPAADETIDCQKLVVMPGMINTHHHMYQSLTRAVPAAQNVDLFQWLKVLYPIWSRLSPEMVNISTKTAMAELLLSGCTTSSDHLYIYPNGCTLDHSIEAAHEIGMRFHAARGAMSVGESAGGLPPDRLVENEKSILTDMQRLIETHHNAAHASMCRVVLAPCSPFSVSTDLMRESAILARQYGVSLHTHLAENDDDVAYSLEKFGRTPSQYAEDLQWVGHDVWHAHCVKLDDNGIAAFAHSGTGVAHCPCSNMRLASGIAPVAKMRAAGVNVGLGVDGSASNDGAHILGEARQAMLLQRVGFGAKAMTARHALELATLGGAKVLNRSDIGKLAEGMVADIACFDVETVDHAGALHDPVAALIFGSPIKATHTIVNGKFVVKDGHLTTLDLSSLVTRHNQLAQILVNG